MSLQRGGGRGEVGLREMDTKDMDMHMWRIRTYTNRRNGEEQDRREDEREDSRGEESDRFNVFVGNLSFRATEEDLYRAFSGYGAV